MIISAILFDLFGAKTWASMSFLKDGIDQELVQEAIDKYYVLIQDESVEDIISLIVDEVPTIMCKINDVTLLMLFCDSGGATEDDSFRYHSLTTTLRESVTNTKIRDISKRFDVIALSSVEIGVIFCGFALLTGSIWAKPTWNAWWPWEQEPRLILITVLLLVYFAYHMLRAFLREAEQKARFSAVYGIVAFAGVPLTFLSIRLWQSVHPVAFASQGGGLAPKMLWTFLFCLATFTALYFVLLIQRFRLSALADQVEDLKRRALH